MITLGDGYAVMLVLPHEDGLSPEQVTALVNDIEQHSFGECEIEPIRIEGEYAWCFGFMSHKAFDEKLDFDARESSPSAKKSEKFSTICLLKKKTASICATGFSQKSYIKFKEQTLWQNSIYHSAVTT